MDRFSAMTTFVRVAELGSLSAAARDLGLSQPAVSQQVAALEKRLGVRLVQRTTRRLALTDAGEAYYTRAKQILATVDEAEEAVAIAETFSGNVRIQAPSGFGQKLLAPLVIAFGQKHPALRVELLLDDRVADMVGEGVDVAIRLGTLPASGLVARKLGVLRRILVASPGYIAIHGSPETPEELARHAHVRYSWLTGGDELSLLGPDGPRSVRVTTRFLANNAFVLIDAIAAGIGIGGTQLPLVREQLENGSLVQVMHLYAYPPMDVHAVYPGAGFIPAKARALVNFLAEALPPLAGLD
ncbi:MAG TPA: LysR family transcriptional regulator [Luteibacter sp.]|jgi:DNA-binding transcriptional LysR family regulator|nr:LysR family transcriptional regulator [Luteibacter sp.]